MKNTTTSMSAKRAVAANGTHAPVGANRIHRPARSPPLAASTSGYRQLIGARHARHRPRRIRKLTRGMLSRGRMRV